jgi:Dynamin family
MSADSDVQRLLDEIAAVADELGDAASARRARAEAGAVSAHVARVVVVGEKKRGKSSLINALLGRPGLLPVDADIATSVHVTVYAADEESALVVDETHPGGLDVPLADIGEYAALDPETMEMRHPGVREVSVGLPDELLQAGITLTDTPGVGGLVSGHAELTLAALSMADALLFVVNGSSELTASECAFLAQATERIASVAFVLTQTDKFPRWRDVLAKDQELIVGHAPQFANARWFPVSSRLRLDAVRAAVAGRTGDAAALDERSGFGPLAEVLTQRIAGRAAELRAANAVWVARQVVAKLTGDTEQRLRSLAKDPRLGADVRAKQEQLAKYRSADAAWRRDLDSEFAKLSQEMLRQYQKRIVDLQGRADQWVAMADSDTVTQVAHDVEAALRAMWADLVSAARAGATAIAARITASLGAEGTDAMLTADVPYPEQLPGAGEFQLPRSQPASGFTEKLAEIWPSLSGFSVTAMAAHVLLGLAVPPLGLISVGGIMAMFLHEGRKKQKATAQARAELHRHVQDALRRAGAEMTPPLLDGVQAMHVAIRDTITGQMEARNRELAGAIVAANRHLEESEQVLAPQRAAAEQALRRLVALVARVDQVTAGVAEGAEGPVGAGEPA